MAIYENVVNCGKIFANETENKIHTLVTCKKIYDNVTTRDKKKIRLGNI